MRNKNVSSGFLYPYPKIPTKWNSEERKFAYGLKDIFDILFNQRTMEKTYPVGIVILADVCPFTFGTWTEIDLGLSGTKAWKRTE